MIIGDIVRDLNVGLGFILRISIISATVPSANLVVNSVQDVELLLSSVELDFCGPKDLSNRAFGNGVGRVTGAGRVGRES